MGVSGGLFGVGGMSFELFVVVISCSSGVFVRYDTSPSIFRGGLDCGF